MTTTEKILSAKHPFDIFEFGEDLKKKYRELIKVVHPDICKEAGAKDAFEKLSKLYIEATKADNLGFQKNSNRVKYKSKSRHSVDFAYDKCVRFELGELYVCKDRIVYIIDSMHKKFYDNYIKVASNFKFANVDMEKEMSRFLPKIIMQDTICDGKLVLMIAKTEDLISLRDIIDHDYKIDPRHIGWIMNALFNIACYMSEYAGITNNGIDLDSCFISAKFHSICLYGGWWYSVPVNQKLIGTTPGIYNLMSIKEKDTKISSNRLDIESIKNIGKILLNKYDKSKTNKSLHDFMVFANNSALTEYQNWSKILKSVYGPPKFIELDLTNKKIRRKLKWVMAYKLRAGKKS